MSKDKKEFIQELLEIKKISNQFKYDVIQSLINNSKADFLCAYDAHFSRLKLDHDDAEMDMATKVCHALMEFMHLPGFKEDKVCDYNNIIEDKIPTRIFSYLLWTQGKDESLFLILKNTEISLSDQEYEELHDLLRPDKFNPKLETVMSAKESKDSKYTKRKNEFLFHIDKYKLLNDLSALPENKEKYKKAKL